METKQLVMDKELHRQVKVMAAEKGMSVKAFVELAVLHFINKDRAGTEKE